MQFLHDKLWKRLKQLCLAAKRRYVAVAYLGHDAISHLPLDTGDYLVVDMSDQSVKTGRTDPHEILRYLDRGVRVYSVENLHAKVFILGPHVIVGSSNVSAHSREVLVEAAVESTDPALRSEALTWLKSVAVAPVTPELAKMKQKLYVPPKWTAPSKSKRVTPTFSRLWIVNTHSSRCTDEEEQILDHHAKSVKRLLPDKERYEVESVRYSVRSRFAQKARLGDLAIQIHKEHETIKVYPPARVLQTRRYKLGDIERIGVHLERRTADKGRSLSAFQKVALAVDVRVTKHSEREVRDSTVHQPLLQFFTQPSRRS